MISNIRRLIGRLDPYTRKVGYYTAYSLSESEYITTVESIEPTELGYEVNNLSAVKTHWDTGNQDIGSYRKVDPKSPKWQFHIHTFATSAGIDVTSHYELRPDFRLLEGESIGDAKNRLERHYRPQKDEYLEGVACEEILTLVG